VPCFEGTSDLGFFGICIFGSQFSSWSVEVEISAHSTPSSDDIDERLNEDVPEDALLYDRCLANVPALGLWSDWERKSSFIDESECSDASSVLI